MLTIKELPLHGCNLWISPDVAQCKELKSLVECYGGKVCSRLSGKVCYHHIISLPKPARNAQRATRNTQHATRNTQHATRNTQYATRKRQDARGKTQLTTQTSRCVHAARNNKTITINTATNTSLVSNSILIYSFSFFFSFLSSCSFLY